VIPPANKDEKKLLFVNKKQQKSFADLGFACTGLPTMVSDPFDQKFS